MGFRVEVNGESSADLKLEKLNFNNGWFWGGNRKIVMLFNKK